MNAPRIPTLVIVFSLASFGDLLGQEKPVIMRSAGGALSLVTRVTGRARHPSPPRLRHPRLDTHRVALIPWVVEADQDEGSAGASIGAGIGLGVVGFLAGGFVGLAAASGCTGDMCGLDEVFYGAAVGGTFGMALGVHLGNRRRGNFLLDLLAGAAVWGAGIGIATASDWDDTVATIALVTIPIAQLATTVAVERATGRSRSKAREVSVSIVPPIGDRIALVASVPF